MLYGWTLISPHTTRRSSTLSRSQTISVSGKPSSMSSRSSSTAAVLRKRSAVCGWRKRKTCFPETKSCLCQKSQPNAAFTITIISSQFSAGRSAVPRPPGGRTILDRRERAKNSCIQRTIAILAYVNNRSERHNALRKGVILAKKRCNREGSINSGTHGSGHDAALSARAEPDQTEGRGGIQCGVLRK